MKQFFKVFYILVKSMKIKLILALMFMTYGTCAMALQATGAVKSVDLSVSGSSTIPTIAFENCINANCPTGCGMSSAATNKNEMLNFLIAAKLRREPITISYKANPGCVINSVLLTK